MEVSLLLGLLPRPLPLLVGHLCPPDPVLVVAGEAVDDDGDWKSEDEDAGEGAHPPDDLTEESAGVDLIPDLCHGRIKSGG